MFQAGVSQGAEERPGEVIDWNIKSARTGSLLGQSPHQLLGFAVERINLQIADSGVFLAQNAVSFQTEFLSPFDECANPSNVGTVAGISREDGDGLVALFGEIFSGDAAVFLIFRLHVVTGKLFRPARHKPNGGEML